MKCNPLPLFAACLLTACALGEPAEGEPAASDIRFSPTAYAEGDFYAVPWPSALRISDGRVDLTGLPARQTNYLMRNVLPLVEDRLDGFSPNGAVMFFLEAELQTGGLPAVTDSTTPESLLQLVNIEPGSTRYGERIPIDWKFQHYGHSFQPDNTLTLLPVPGFPMAPGEQYAALLLDGLETEHGALRGSPLVQDALARPEAHPTLQFHPLGEALPDLGLTSASIAAATVFRTADPTRAVRLARDVVQGLDAPVATDVEGDPYSRARCLAEEPAAFDLVQGRLQLPIFLSGPAPYLTPGTGVFRFDDHTGEPLIHSWEEVPFTLSIPDEPVPDGGFPVVLYMHGAEGSRHSFARDRTACSLAHRGLAGLAIDFPVHGDRNPWGHEELFLLLNPNNIPALLDLESQAAIDLFTLTRLVPGLVVPEDVLGRGTGDIHFRGEALGFIGHSQGALVGVPFLAFEEDVSATVLSGSGAHFITFVTDRVMGESIDLQILLGVDDGAALEDGIAVLLGIPGETPDRFHFLFTLVQSVADSVDPVNYAPYVIRETSHPKHVYQSAGFLDTFDPPAVNEALATALGLDMEAPVGMRFPRLELRGGVALTPPIQGNITVGDRTVTGVNSHYPDGDHWVYLSDSIARKQGTDFLSSALTEEVAVVPQRCEPGSPCAE